MDKRGTRLEHLDMLRGCAALLVMLGHLRAFTFVNLGAVPNKSVAVKAFYAMTSLGTEAVIVFFVLSGYLVGGKVIADMLSARWNWGRYLLRRLTRLWIVLVPALVLTAVLDWVGQQLGGNGYGGQFYSIYFSGPTNLNTHLLSTWFGNLFFLHTVTVPVFGSNGPMWSLANEFWYYALFPLIAFAALVRSHAATLILTLAVLVALLLWLPVGLLLPGLIWAAGAGAAWTMKRPYLGPILHSVWYRAVVFTLAVAALAYTKVPGASYADYLFGFAVALCLPALAFMPTPGRIYDVAGRELAEISYTLYLTHFPLLTFVFFTFLAPERSLPGLKPMIFYFVTAMAAVIWARMIWWCFERHTDRTFRFLLARLPASLSSDSEIAQTSKAAAR